MNTDLELVNATLSGDKSAFEVLASRYQTQVYRLAYRIIHNQFDASDIAQETLLKAYQNLERLKNRERFSSWLFQIAKNQCISWIRKYERSAAAVGDELANNRLVLPAAPDEILIKDELHQRIMDEVSKLPEHSRRAIEMFYFDGKSYSQIQDELGITKGTLGRRLHRAKSLLKKKLQEVYLSAAILTGNSLRRALKLSSGQASAVAASGTKCLAISIALHVLVFAGMSFTGANWGISGKSSIAQEGGSIEVMMIKMDAPERVYLPSRAVPPSISHIISTSKKAGMEQLKNIVPELKLSRFRKHAPKIRSFVPSSSIYMKKPALQPVVGNARGNPSLSNVIPSIKTAPPKKSVSLRRSQYPSIANRLPDVRSGSDFMPINSAAEPVTDVIYNYPAKIFFVSNRESRNQPRIYAMNIDGTGVIPVEEDDMLVYPSRASVSSKEKRIAFHTQTKASNSNSFVGKGYYICIMDMATGYYRPVTIGLSPDLSPDGDRIAFCRSEGPNSEIYVVNEDGSGLVKITENRSSSYHPIWSPDGAKIAFSSSMRTDRRIRNIFVMDADGSDQAQLTHTDTVGRWNDHPAWSPDGTKIAYASGKIDKRRNRIQSTIFIMDANGNNRKALVTRAYYPSWSPDGQKIVFCSNRDGNEEIYIIDIDGKNLKRLTHNHCHDTQPSWLPAGLLR